MADWGVDGVMMFVTAGRGELLGRNPGHCASENGGSGKSYDFRLVSYHCVNQRGLSLSFRVRTLSRCSGLVVVSIRKEQSTYTLLATHAE